MGKVNLIQYVHPHGRKRDIWVDNVPDDVCKMAESQVLSCECMPSDYSKIVFYSHIAEGWDEDKQDEEIEIACNGPGENGPKNTLIKLIRRVNELQSKTEATNPKE